MPWFSTKGQIFQLIVAIVAAVIGAIRAWPDMMSSQYLAGGAILFYALVLLLMVMLANLVSVIRSHGVKTPTDTPSTVPRAEYETAIQASASHEKAADLNLKRAERAEAEVQRLNGQLKSGVVIVPAPRDSPILQISNGSAVTLSGQPCPFNAVTIKNTAAHAETNARNVVAKVTYRHHNYSFAVDRMHWTVWRHAQQNLEIIQMPWLSSMSMDTFSLPLFFYWVHAPDGYYAASFPPRPFDNYRLDMGDWKISIELRDEDGNQWNRELTVELRPGKEPKWTAVD